MKGLELARRFWQATRSELFEGELADLAPRVAAGLVGEGSECFGFDDETSRDHDWGPGYCIWLEDADVQRFGAQLAERYERIASKSFMDVPPRPMPSQPQLRRVGVFSTSGFYHIMLRGHLPTTLHDWLALDEHALAAATNGSVFTTCSCTFTDIRTRLLAYYPEDIRLLRIASGCAVAAQAGQYNLPRQLARNDRLAAQGAFSRFADAMYQIVYALARRYRPFYKWTPRGLLDLGVLGRTTHEHLTLVLDAVEQHHVRRACEHVETICDMVARALVREGISRDANPWLMEQAGIVADAINDDELRRTNLLSCH